MKRFFQITLLLAGLAWCVSARAAGAYVGSVAKYGDNSSAGSQTTGSYSATSGNVLVAFTGYANNTGTISSVQDVAHTANFTQGTSCLSQTTLTSNDTLDVWYLVVPATSATTYKVTFSTTQTFGHLYVLEFSGIDTTTPLDFCTIVTAASGVTSITSGSFTPNTNGGINVFGVRWPGGVGTAVTAGANYTMRQSSCTSGCISNTLVASAAETRDNAPNSAQTASMSWTTAKTAKGVVITLRAPAAAGTFVPQIGGFLVGP